MQSRRARGEDGATLILALGFLLAFSALIPALLTLGVSNLQATSRLHQQRAVVYTADAATDAAIQYLRSHPGCGIPFQVQGSAADQCPSGVYSGLATDTFAVTLNSQSARATITARGNALDRDRTVDIATAVPPGGTVLVNAHVVIRDSGTTVLAPEPKVDVQSWVYTRS